MNASSVNDSLFDIFVLPSIKVKVRARSSMWTLSKPVVSRGGIRQTTCIFHDLSLFLHQLSRHKPL